MKSADAVTLSEEQARAVRHPLGLPAVVAAGAGTGKTFTIVERVAALHESGICPADNILLLTFARKAAAELRARIAQRLPGARPHCSTFHAFAWQILSAHAYDIGLSPETQVVEDVDARVEFRKAFREYLNRPSAPESGFPLRQFNQAEIREGLFALSQDLKQRGLSIAAFRERALAAADMFERVPFRAVLQPYKTNRRPKVVAEIDDATLAQEIGQEKARVETAAGILRCFEQRLAERKLLTYADILHGAGAAIRTHAGLQAELRTRYRCCIVDEYQDTDLAQHRLLESIYGAGLAEVMVVGDVLQSIYAFRGAQPENIERIQTASRAVTYALVQNRRSLQNILNVAHAVIIPAHKEAVCLHAARGNTQQQNVQVSSLFRGENGEHLPADQAREVEAAAVTRQLSSLLHSGCSVEDSRGERRPLRAGDVAILSRTKLNVQPVTEALLAAGLPFRLVGGVGFYDAPEIRDAMAWLRLLADPFNSYAVARVLQSPLIGLNDVAMTEIAHHLGTDATSLSRRVLLDTLRTGAIGSPTARNQFAKFHELLDALAPFAALPLSAAFAAVLERTELLQYWEASSLPRAAQAVANLQKLESLARKFSEQTPAAQAADFVALLEELERVDYDEREADVIADDVVTISTIHAAKGLEWPIVFILGVWPAARSGPRLRIDENSGALLYAESPDGSRPFHYTVVDEHAGPDGIVAGEEGDEKRKKDAEERRLFYVALTRARDQVFISGLRGKPSKPNPLGKPHAFLQAVYDWFSKKQWTTDCALPESVPMRALPGSVRTASLPALMPVGARSNSRATALRQPLAPGNSLTAGPARSVPALSFSSLARYERCPRSVTYQLMYGLPDMTAGDVRRWALTTADEAAADDGQAAADSLLAAGDYGSLVHKALELWALDRRSGKPAEPSETYVDGAAGILDLKPPSSQRRNAQLVVADASRQLAGWKPLHIEAPFTLDFGSPGWPLLVSGYIDLVALDDDTRACLLDYKTGLVDQASHGLQIALYQRAAAFVYGVEDAIGFIGRVTEGVFSLEAVAPIEAQVLDARITAVRDGLLAVNDTPRPGVWCFQCPYREAPCQDYLRR